jgi:HlyD family secretion protein
VDDGQTVDVSMDAYPSIPFQGKVARINPQAVVEQNVTTVHVRVEMDNSSPTFRLLKPGMNASCEFVMDQKDNVVNVPSDAIHTDDKGSYVLIASGGMPAPADPKTGTPADPSVLVGVKTRQKRVEVGLEGNDSTEITSGLKGGEMVVTETIDNTPQAPSSPFAGGRGPGGFGGGRRGG